MSKNIVICFDGTNNEFGKNNTNVVRLVQALAHQPSDQIVYYDPGVGTLPESGVFTKIGKWISKARGLAFGAGLGWKVRQAYMYLMDNWEPDDTVLIFGFSRGAYSARVLAGLLHTLGLLQPGNYDLVRYLFRLYKGARKKGPEAENHDSRYWVLCRQFRETFARKVGTHDEEGRFSIHFLGVWDTVSSVGWVWNPATFTYTAKNPSIEIIRHAVSIDERRAFFRQNLMHPSPGQNFKELWFAGVHCDIGGGYPLADGGLWKCAFEWMVSEAKNAGGLLIDERRLAEILQGEPEPWKDPQHESLSPVWWPVEFFPKLVRNPSTKTTQPRMNLGRPRYIEPGALIHKTALLRIRETQYNPKNFTLEILARIRELKIVPDEFLF